MRKLALALLAAAALVLGAGVVAGAYPPGAMTAAVTSVSVGPGADVTVQVEGCSPNDLVTFRLEGSTSTDTCAGGTGTLSLLVAAAVAGTAQGVVTAPTVPGEYTGTASGPASGQAGFTVTVHGASTAPPPVSNGSLPSTGSDGVMASMWIAAGLFVVGLGLFAVSQLRRRRAPAT